MLGFLLASLALADPVPYGRTGLCVDVPERFVQNELLGLHDFQGQQLVFQRWLDHDVAADMQERVVRSLSYEPGSAVEVDTLGGHRAVVTRLVHSSGRVRPAIAGIVEHPAGWVVFLASGDWDWRSAMASLKPCGAGIEPRYTLPLSREFRPVQADPYHGKWQSKEGVVWLSVEPDSSARPIHPLEQIPDTWQSGSRVQLGSWDARRTLERRQGRWHANWALRRDGVEVAVGALGVPSRKGIRHIERALSELELRPLP